jgi:hypothetical protein
LFKKKKGWLGPRDGLGAVKKRRNSAVGLSDNKNKNSTHKTAQQDDVTSENPLLLQTELAVPDATSAASNCTELRMAQLVNIWRQENKQFFKCL